MNWYYWIVLILFALFWFDKIVGGKLLIKLIQEILDDQH